MTLGLLWDRNKLCCNVSDSHSKCKENKENKNVKRKLSENSFYLPFARKSRRTEASKELNVSVNSYFVINLPNFLGFLEHSVESIKKRHHSLLCHAT